MPIHIVCTGCKKSFHVSEKFAGKKGPCPKCKTILTIPELGDQVVVHEAEHDTPKDSTGRSVLKPILRQETKVSMIAWVGVGAIIFGVLVIALVLRFSYGGETSSIVLALGAVLLAPPLVVAGYSFLRDDELEPFRGSSLWTRALICSLVYSSLWAVYAYLPAYVFGIERMEMFHLVFVVPPMVLIGAFAAFACMDVDYGSGLVHYAFYLLVTAALCYLIKIPLFELEIKKAASLGQPPAIIAESFPGGRGL